MIIQCVNCNKNFEVDSSLIPAEGRNIQCGSCNHIWFYKNPKDSKFESSKEIIINDENVTIKDIKKDDQKVKKSISKRNLQKNLEKKDSIKSRKTSNFGLGSILSFLIVGLITFIAIIIILDTFKNPLSNIYPELELLLYNLFETIKDIILFLINLTN